MAVKHTYCIAVSHTPWVPERVETYRRLWKALRLDQWDVVHPGMFRCFDEKAPNHVWSRQMWAWAADTGAEWCVFLQDDTVVSPSIHSDLEWCFDSCGDAKVIGLQVAHPIAVSLFNEGFQAFTTNDALVGVGYAIKADALADFFDWTELHAAIADKMTEDTLLGVWCAMTGTKVWHPIPTCVDHDVTVASVYGNDNHGNRRSRVNWNAPQRDKEALRDEVPHAGCFYSATAETAKRFGCDDETYNRLRTDNGVRLQRRITYLRRARLPDAPVAKLFIGTPTRGEVHPNFAASIWRIMRDEDLEIDGEELYRMYDVQMQSVDVVRTRSKLVSVFLRNTDATHLLFLDDDIEVAPKVIRGMLAADRPFVACPYPRRDHLEFSSVQKNASLPGEASAYRYSVRMLPSSAGLQPDKQGCVEVEGIPLGCALIRRDLLQRMWDHYAPTLTFIDEGFAPAVALFQLIMNVEEKALYSEDYSFCRRLHEMGEKVWMYLGDGSPVNHWGQHCYKGAIEAFRLRRV